MNEQMKFFIFLIENYANKTGRDTGEVMKEWDEHGITQKIYDSYEMYHQESLENAFEDIESLIRTGKHAW